MNAIAKAENAAKEYEFFLANAVGKSDALGSNEEFSILVEWSDAIDQAINACLSARDWTGDSYFCAMQDECNRYLDAWREKQ